MKKSYKQFTERLQTAPGKAHFAGIGGIGMAGVAYLLKQLGWEVSGCDIIDNPMMRWLAKQGIAVSIGNSPDHINELDPKHDIVVRTPAVPLASLEMAEARSLKIPVYDRGVVLAAISASRKTIAICGTHGKTTTSCFIAGIMGHLHPNHACWCIGGVSPHLGAVAGGEVACSLEESAPLVIEADESDGTLAMYAPHTTVLTNLDLDHLEYFRDAEELEDSFRAVLRNTTGSIVYCADHARTAKVAAEAYTAKRVSYGLNPGADYRIFNSITTELSCSFMLAKAGEETVNVTLSVPGRHNILNATAAIAAVCENGIGFKEACVALEKTATLPARRFERIGNPDGFIVISDYSHHPTEITALVEAAQDLPHKRIVGIFEPHRYTRTKILLDGFPSAFIGVDHLVLCPVFSASENAICGGTSADLYTEFREKSADNISIPIPVLAKSLETATAYVKAILQPGDLVLVIGAGDVNTIAPALAAAHPVTTLPQELRLGAFGTSAIAPNLTAVRDIEQLQHIVKTGDFCVIAGGTNSFVPATGCHQHLIRLAGSKFDYVRVIQDNLKGVILEVGAAKQGPGFLRYCCERGYSGLEFMAGIPGMCGGWLTMNAGTRFGSIGDAVISADVVDANGDFKTIDISDLNAGYRSCPGLKGCVAVSMRLKMSKSTPALVRKAMDDALEHRMDFSGIRTGGSVFKNPGEPLPTAGTILDAAGCRGLCIGGAYVTQRHANVIAAEQDATASDVYALMHMMRERAYESSGIRLEPEIRIPN